MPNWVRQAAAIPVFDGKVCLVTSRSGRRWVLPKGQIEPGQTSAEAALVESWEEAGLVGELDQDPVGTYTYQKLSREHHVIVYRMHVSEVREVWPERLLRHRTWLSVHEAMTRIHEPGLQNILRRVFQLRQISDVQAVTV